MVNMCFTYIHKAVSTENNTYVSIKTLISIVSMYTVMRNYSLVFHITGKNFLKNYSI